MIDKASISPSNIEKMRSAAGLNVEQSSRLLGVTSRAWEYWESGEREMRSHYVELYCLKTGLNVLNWAPNRPNKITIEDRPANIVLNSVIVWPNNSVFAFDARNELIPIVNTVEKARAWADENTTFYTGSYPAYIEPERS